MAGASDTARDREVRQRLHDLERQAQDPNLPAARRADAAVEMGRLYAGLRRNDAAVQWIEYAARTYASHASPGYLNQAGAAHSLAADVSEQAGDMVSRAEFLRRAAWAYTLAGNHEAANEAQHRATLPPGPTAPGRTGPEALSARAPQSSTAFSAFVRLNAYDQFDLLALNTINLAEVVQEAHQGSREDLHLMRSVAESLLPRVRSETEDREPVAELLRDLAIRWYLGVSSPSSAAGARPWTEWASEALSGLFYESRVPGGRRKPRLADRLLWASRGKPGPGEGGKLGIFGGGTDGDESETLKGCPPEELLLLRVAQAILDDLSAFPRGSNTVVVLLHLSDLAAAVTSREVNVSLQSMLSPAGENSFQFLDAGRQPGVGQVLLRWPNPRIASAATHYDLLVSPPAGPPGGTLDHGPVESQPPGPDLSRWYEQARSRTEWVDLLSALDRQQARLPRPPALAASQRLAGYLSLRAALVAGPPATDVFERVHWKDQPRGLLILNELLRTGAYSPDVDTDQQYLELELNDFAYGSPKPATDDGIWRLGNGQLIRRTLSSDGTVRYELAPDPGTRATPP